MGVYSVGELGGNHRLYYEGKEEHSLYEAVAKKGTINTLSFTPFSCRLRFSTESHPSSVQLQTASTGIHNAVLYLRYYLVIMETTPLQGGFILLRKYSLDYSPYSQILYNIIHLSPKLSFKVSSKAFLITSFLASLCLSRCELTLTCGFKLYINVIFKKLDELQSQEDTYI